MQWKILWTQQNLGRRKKIEGTAPESSLVATGLLPFDHIDRNLRNTD